MLQKRTGQLKINPCIDIERKKYVSGDIHIPYPEAVFADIVSSARKKRKKDLLLMIHILYYCFMRPSEVLKIKRKHIHDDLLEIPGRVNTKINNKNFRQIPTSLNNILNEYKARELDPEEYIISNIWTKHKRAVNKNYVYSAHVEILKELKIHKKGYTLYGYKHTGNIALFRQFKDVKINMLQNGHDNPETTRIYLRGLGVIMEENILNFK